MTGATFPPQNGTCAALVCTGPGAAAYEEVSVPGDFGAGGLGRVLISGVCGSDIALFRGSEVAARQWPLILGHEPVVVVEECSPALQERWGVSSGQRVFVEEFVPCGWCDVCRGGDPHLCPGTDFNSADFTRYGRTSLTFAPGLWGGFADLLYLHPNARLHPLPASVPPHLGVLATPIANGLRWVGHVGGIRPGDDVVVIGPGAHGLGCLVAARELGAGSITLVGRSTDRTRMTVGTALGADGLLFSDEEDVPAAVLERTRGRGADVVVDASGSEEGACLAPLLAALFGRVVLAGGQARAAQSFPLGEVMRKELRVRGVRGHRGRDIAQAIEVIASGRHQLELLTTDLQPLSEGPSLLAALSQPDGRDLAPHYALVPDQQLTRVTEASLADVLR